MSSSTKRNDVIAGLDDNESTDNKKQNNRCGKEEETLATITTDMKHTLNDDKPGEYYYEMEAEEQKQWKLESEREARLEATRKQREEHWKELEAIRNLEEEYEEDHELEEEDKDNEYESNHTSRNKESSNSIDDSTKDIPIIELSDDEAPVPVKRKRGRTLMTKNRLHLVVPKRNQGVHFPNHTRYLLLMKIQDNEFDNNNITDEGTDDDVGIDLEDSENNTDEDEPSDDVDELDDFIDDEDASDDDTDDENNDDDF
ncbi:hypothetical protein Tco_0020126 [Tanacetum coccineum]